MRAHDGRDDDWAFTAPRRRVEQREPTEIEAHAVSVVDGDVERFRDDEYSANED